MLYFINFNGFKNLISYSSYEFKKFKKVNENKFKLDYL
jgi:hypothetical protein